MRAITTGARNAINAENAVTILMAELDFASGFVRVHTGVGDIAYAGNTYVGVGNLGGVERINESSELQASGVRLTLSGVPNDLVSVALSENYQGRAARLWIGLLNEQHTLIADPIGPFGYRMDSMSGEIGQMSTLVLTAEDIFADWDRPRVRRYSDADQKAEYPADRGFEHTAQMVEKTLFWGRVVVGFST